MSRPTPGLFTRWELGLGVIVSLVVGAFAASEIQRFQHRRARAEVGMVLTAMRIHLDEVESPKPFGPTPRGADALSTRPLPWDGSPLQGFTPPRPTVRGSYSLQAGDPMTLVGRIDADGDGEPAAYRLPLVEGALRRLTPEDVY